MTLKGVIKSGKIASVREVLLRKDGDTKHAVAVVLNVELATDKTFGEINKRIRIDTQSKKPQISKTNNDFSFRNAPSKCAEIFRRLVRSRQAIHGLRISGERKTGRASPPNSTYRQCCFEHVQLSNYEDPGQYCRRPGTFAQPRNNSRQLARYKLVSYLFTILYFKASVIYLTEENIPKIGKVCNNRIKSNDRNLWRWWAPEVFENGQKHSREADIWAFGVVMWEVCTFGGLPYNDVDLDQLSQYVKYDR